MSRNRFIFRPANERCPKCGQKTLRWSRPDGFAPPTKIRCTTPGCGWLGERADLTRAAKEAAPISQVPA